MNNAHRKQSTTLALCGLLSLAATSLLAEVPIPDEFKTGGLAIGCQAYTFNRFSAFEAIEKTAQAGAKVIEFYPGQRLGGERGEAKLDHNMSDDLIAVVKAKLQKHGIRAVNYGVVGLPNNEAECRKVFSFARKLGLRAVTTEAGADAMDLLERLVKEYDIMVAIHNHPKQPDNPKYQHWDPQFVLSLVKGRDPRMGACADTGHWVRSGLKPVEALRILKGRIVSVHLKDLNQFDRSAHDVPYGTGVADMGAVIRELRKQKFQGNASIEYEHNWDNSVPEVAQCIGFVRGFGAASR